MNRPFYSENGIADLLAEAVAEDKWLHAPVVKSEQVGGVFVDLAFGYQKDFATHIRSFANNIDTHEGGTHEQGFVRAVVKAVNDYAAANVPALAGKPFGNEDITEGLSACIAVRLSEPKFVGQTKGKLSTSEAGSAVYQFTRDLLSDYLEKHPDIAKTIVSKAVSARRAREAAANSRARVRREEAMNTLGTLPGKLADCQTKDMEASEIFIVEGDSAGGSAKQGRDRVFQAILPLRGKVMNAGKSETERMTDSEQIRNLVSALGTGIGKDFNLDKLRYGKIIIMTDADVDGSHIAVLLLTFFVKHMPEVLKAGRVYLATPPLLRVKKKSGGGEVRYYATEADLEADFPAGETRGWDVSRFKGLGEMDPEQLWDTTMNPESRRLQRVALTEDQEGDVQAVFEMLMGKDVPPRRRFIEDNAQYANVDV